MRSVRYQCDRTGKYEEVGKGKINLRYHAVALESASGWEKGARLAEHTVSFFLNTDPSLGFFEDTETFQGGPNSARSEVQPLGSKSWKLRLNTTHPAYEAIKEEEERVKVLQKQLELGSAGGLSELAHEEVLDKIASRDRGFLGALRERFLHGNAQLLRPGRHRHGRDSRFGSQGLNRRSKTNTIEAP